MIRIAIGQEAEADQDRRLEFLERLSKDPSFRVMTDSETGQTLIAGMGELHLEVVVDRLLGVGWRQCG